MQRLKIFCGLLALASGLRSASAELLINDRAESIAVVEAWIKDHPQDPDAYYVLARIHALVWAGDETTSLGWLEKKGYPFLFPNGPEDVLITRDRKNTPIIPQDPRGLPKLDLTLQVPEDFAELQASIDAYTKAVKLAPQNPLYHEGLAWMLQQKGQAGPPAALEINDLTPAEKTNIETAIRLLAASDYQNRENGSKLLRETMPRGAALLKTAKSDDIEVTARIAAIFRDYYDLQALPHYRQAYALSVAADLKDANQRFGYFISEGVAIFMLQIFVRCPEAAKPGEIDGLTETVETFAEKRKTAPLGP